MTTAAEKIMLEASTWRLLEELGIRREGPLSVTGEVVEGDGGGGTLALSL